MTCKLPAVLIWRRPVPVKKSEDKTNQEIVPIKKKKYERELRKLQTKLVEMQEWVRTSGSKVVLYLKVGMQPGRVE
jgi:polyphosphate kinase 2 (PPK2 family)